MIAMPQRTLMLSALGRDAGLTSATLGLLRALQRDGLRVGFVKPIAQIGTGANRTDLSTFFARALCHLNAPEPLSYAHAEAMLRSGRLADLLEEIVKITEIARAGHDVLVVEGLIADAQLQVGTQLNLDMARSLTADVVLVASGNSTDARELAESIKLAACRYTQEAHCELAGVLLNKSHAALDTHRLEFELKQLTCAAPLLGSVPFEARLNALRLQDVVNALDLTVAHAGNMSASRVQEVVVAASSVDYMADRLRPGALVVTAGDRSDIVLATALATLRGVPLAGLLLTCGTAPAPKLEPLIHSARLAGLPILSTPGDTFETSAGLAALSTHASADDTQRMEQVIEFVADHIDVAPVKHRIGQPATLRMPPPAFRHRLVERARAAGKTIVLPEGEEPRTVQAAVICHEKRIARCVLLGDPARIRESASVQGITLPKNIEIIDPATVRSRYVAPMVELRRNRGLSAQQAEAELEDNVVLGTMMLAQGEVDGLVSGAVHTTANTVRPALQLIKTAPGTTTVSSVFFMLMPDQVLVYGDCAINPNPTPEQLADIAIQSADSARAFGLEPRVAMISYSTGTSGSGDDVESVREATRLARALRPDLLIDGPMQYDAASVASVGRQKAPDSPVAGCANVFVFPDLNTGNTTYKAVQRSANVVSIGPMLQGLRRPVNDLSRGALVDDIVYTIALTAVQAAWIISSVAK